MPAKTLEQELIIGPDKYVNLVAQAKDRGAKVSLILQIQSARLIDEIRPKNKRKGLVDMWFWPGDGCGYGLNGEDIIFYHTDVANNYGLENPKEFARQLIDTDAFFLNPKKSSTLKAKVNDIDDDGVASFNISELRRQGVLNEDEHRNNLVYVEVSTNILMQGEGAFRKKYGNKVTDLFNRVQGKAMYGKTGIGAKLRQRGKDITRIYFFNPNNVRNKLAQEEKGTTLWRPSCVDLLSNYSFVDLGGGFLNFDVAHLHSVVKNSSQGGHAKKCVAYTPQGILDYLEKNPVSDKKFADGLLNEVNRYYQKQK